MRPLPQSTPAIALPSRFVCWFVHARVFRACYTAVMKTFFGLKVRHPERMQPPGPYIVAFNHGSHYDLFFTFALVNGLMGEFPAAAVWRGTLEMPIVGPALRALPSVCVGIRKDKLQRMAATRAIIRLLKQGHTMVMSCEGIRRDTLGEFQPGTAFASLHTGVPVLPISLRGIQGLYSEMSGPDRFWGRVEIVLHPPLHPAEFRPPGRSMDDAIEAMTQAVRRSIASAIDYPDERAGTTIR
jgi:1-acyl-sn-glycerol-3-phosphate acyltransferase